MYKHIYLYRYSFLSKVISVKYTLFKSFHHFFYYLAYLLCVTFVLWRNPAIPRKIDLMVVGI